MLAEALAAGLNPRELERLIRPTDDLNLLCRVCNAAHYLESKYGDLPFLIVWGARRVR